LGFCVACYVIRNVLEEAGVRVRMLKVPNSAIDDSRSIRRSSHDRSTAAEVPSHRAARQAREVLLSRSAVARLGVA